MKYCTPIKAIVHGCLCCRAGANWTWYSMKIINTHEFVNCLLALQHKLLVSFQNLLLFSFLTIAEEPFGFSGAEILAFINPFKRNGRGGEEGGREHGQQSPWRALAKTRAVTQRPRFPEKRNLRYIYGMDYDDDDDFGGTDLFLNNSATVNPFLSFFYGLVLWLSCSASQSEQ